MKLQDILLKLVMKELPAGVYATEEGITFTLVPPHQMVITAGKETRELATPYELISA